MKTTFEIIAVVAAVAAVSVSCSKNELDVKNIHDNPKVTIKVNAVQSDLTRTAVDATNAVSWSAGDAIGIFQSVDGVKGTAKVTSTGLAAASDKASFSATFDVAEGSEYKYMAAYPASAIEWSTDTTFAAFGQEFPYSAKQRVNDSTFLKDKLTELFHERYRVIIPRDQRPTETSWDPAADVLVSKVVTSAAQPGELNMEFHRLGTAVKMTLSGLPAGEIIKYVDVSTTETKLCGRTHINPLTGAIYDKAYSSGGNMIHIMPSTARTTTGNDVFWFRAYAGTLRDNLSVVVVTDQAYYVKTVDLKSTGRSIVFSEEGLTDFTVEGLSRHSTPEDLDRTGWVVTTSHPVFQEKAANASIEFAQALVDGDPATRFCLIRPGKGPVRTATGATLQVSKTDTTWFQLDLLEAKTVSCFHSIHRTGNTQLRLAGMDEIRGSNDGEIWNTIVKDIKIYNVKADTQNTEIIPIPSSTYRYYKFIMLDQKCFNLGYYVSNGNTWQICEFYLGD